MIHTVLMALTALNISAHGVIGVGSVVVVVVVVAAVKRCSVVCVNGVVEHRAGAGRCLRLSSRMSQVAEG